MMRIMKRQSVVSRQCVFILILLLTIFFILQNLSKLKQQWSMEAVPNQQVNNSSQTVAAEKSQQTATHVKPAPSHSAS